MGKMKRFFSLMLVLTIVLGSFSSVFAAEEVKTAANEELKKVPSDVIGTEYEKAVARLVAFGVLDGYKDGTYRPDQDVTRAEFAKILVEALGIGNAAKADKGKVTFKDVPASHWASGYVSVASGMGLLKGFPDGTFKPEQQVSYADALTMLVRSLGYQDEFLKGAWPGSHIAKAAEAGITAGVKFEDARGFANRGNVAQVVNNTLDCDVVKVKTYKDGTVEYEESDKTLLKDKLDISKYEDTRVMADKILDDGLAKDEITVLFTKTIERDDDSVKKTYKEGTDKDFTIKNGVNPRPLIGEKVSVYMDNNENVIYIEAQDDDKVEFDYIVEIEDDVEVSLAKLDKEYKFDKEAKVYVYDQDKDAYKLEKGEDLVGDKAKENIEKLDLPGSVGKFVIKNNRIIFAEIFKSTEVAPLFVVMENDKGNLEGINQTTEDYKLDLVKDGTYDDILVYDINGNKMDVEDIEKGNVLYVQMLDYDGDDVALVRVVTDNKLEGKIGRFREDRVEIDGKFKTAVKFDAGSGMIYDAYYTINTLEDIERWNDSDWENDLDDANDEDATVYLDAVGRIAFLHTGAESTSGYKFGIVTRTYADKDRVRIFTSLDGKDGKDIVFKADKERNLENPKVIRYEKGQFSDPKTEKYDILGAAVKFRLNKDGEISEDEFYVMDRSAVFAMNADFGKDSMRVVPFEVKGNDVNEGKATSDKTSFSVKDGVSIIDAEGLNPLDTRLEGTGDIEVKTNVDIDDFNAVTWKDIKDTKKDDEVRFYVFPRKSKSEEVEGMIFVGKAGANTASDKEAIYVRDRWRKGDDIVIEYIAYGSDERKTATVDGTYNISEIERRSPYVAEKRSNDKFRLYDRDNRDKDHGRGVVADNDVFFRFVEGRVDEITGSRISIKGKTGYYTIDSRAVVYSGGDKKQTSSIRKDDKVLMIVEDDIKVRVVQIDAKIKEYTEAELKALEAVEKAEETKTQADIDAAQALVDKLSAGDVKTDLQERLDQIKVPKTDLEKATEAVEKAKETKKQADFDAAQELVDALPAGPERVKLQKELNDLKSELAPEPETVTGVKATGKVTTKGTDEVDAVDGAKAKVTIDTDIDIEAIKEGKAGNQITIEVVQGEGENKELAVDVIDNRIKVTLSTDAAANPDATRSDVADAINAKAGDLVVATTSSTELAKEVARVALKGGVDSSEKVDAKKEVYTLTVTSGATANGTILVKGLGTGTGVEVEVVKGMTAAMVAKEIGDEVTSTEYDITVDGAKVVFTAKTAGEVTTPLDIKVADK